MKVKRMGITEILRRILLFSANKIKSSESCSSKPTQLIVELKSSLRQIIVTQSTQIQGGRTIMLFWSTIFLPHTYFLHLMEMNNLLSNYNNAFISLKFSWCGHFLFSSTAKLLDLLEIVDLVTELLLTYLDKYNSV